MFSDFIFNHRVYKIRVKVAFCHCHIRDPVGIIIKIRVIVVPETYMNNSGESINAAMHWFKTDESRLIVIYDDFDLPAGQIRIRSKGSAGTHNGMKSVLQYTDTDEFVRIRIGIGPKEKEMDIIKFVLGTFPRDQKERMDNAFDRAAEAALAIIKSGVNDAMNRFNQASIS